jgi:hypothetical protein
VSNFERKPFVLRAPILNFNLHAVNACLKSPAKLQTMSITNQSELLGMQKASEAVALTLKEMIQYTQPGMTTKELDTYGAQILSNLGAK